MEGSIGRGEISMEVQYKRNHRESYMILESESYQHNYEERMLKENQLRSLLSFYTMQIDGTTQFWYDITGLQSLQDYFDRENVTLQNLEQVVMYLVLAFEEMQKYLLDQKKIYLDSRSIYLRRQEPFRLYLCYCPFVPEEEAGMRKITEYLLTIVDHGQQDLMELCYALYEKSLLDGTTLYDLQLMIQEATRETSKMDETEQFPDVGACENVTYEKTDPSEEIREEDMSEKVGGGSRWKEKLQNFFGWLSEKIKTIFHSSLTEQIYEKNFEIEPEPIYCEPTVLLHSGEQQWEGRLVYQGSGEEEDFLIQGEVFRIGSAREDNDGWLRSQAVSRRHAKISRNGKQFILEDLNSTNGTTVNGRELNYQEKYALTGGDRIRFADVSYLFL
jgi:hypothetical protein